MESTYSITGHPTYKSAHSANAVVRYIAPETYPFSREEQSGMVHALKVGESVAFDLLHFQGEAKPAEPVVVTRNR
jgi:hypothetical protein